MFADIKPNNILANNGTGNARFGTIQLGDFGDSVPEEIATNNGGHIISAPIYRAPEVILNARWTVAVDIWSLGATVSCYDLYRIILWGWLLIIVVGDMLSPTKAHLRASWS